MTDADGGDGRKETDGTNPTDPDHVEPPAEPGWVREQRAYRGIPRRLAAHYLRNLGGTLVDADDPADATRVDGDGWRVTLSSETVNVAGSISVTEVTMSFAGDPEVLADLIPRFKRKAMRAGG